MAPRQQPEEGSIGMLAEFCRVWTSRLSPFRQHRTVVRGLRLALSMLLNLGRHTITGTICTAGRQFQDWSADYRFFARACWTTQEIFDPILDGVLKKLRDDEPLIVALDDTKVRKTGTNIPGVSYHRDPMSPPFHANIVLAQRFSQASAMLPDRRKPGRARSIPIRFEHTPSVPRPSRRAPAEEWQEYRRRCRTENLSTAGAEIICGVRISLDEMGSQQRTIVAVTDGSFCNRNFIRNLPENTVLIGRCRADTRLHYPATAQQQRGRTRVYGELAPTPERLRQDDSTPWQVVHAFAAGCQQAFHVKRIGPVLWRNVGGHIPLQCVAIRPLGYRLHKGSRILYRRPAYLLCTDPDMPLQELVQAYVYRWEIEVNHRDEKQIIGVGEEQVWSEKSVDRVPAFKVAAYAALQLVGSELCGPEQAKEMLPPPKWRRGSYGPRITTYQMVQQLRREIWSDAFSSEISHFTGFVPDPLNNSSDLYSAKALFSSVFYNTP